MTTTIKMETIVAAIIALQKALQISFNKPGLTVELIRAKCDLEYAIRDIQVEIKEAA